MHDLRHALRQLVKSRGFTATALLMLAIGIGATTVTFSLVNAVLLRPFPAVQPERLVALNETNEAQGFGAGMSISYANFVDWRRDNRTLENPALYEEMGYTLAGDGPAEHVDGAHATAGFFEAFGATPEIGRTFRIEEESLSGPRVVVLSHERWVRQYHGDPAVLGRTLRLNGFPYTIIGVMPAGFRYPGNAALWTTLQGSTSDDERGSRSYDGIARLKSGVTLEQARLDLAAIAANIARAHPISNANSGILVTPFVAALTGNYGRIVLTLFGAVGCLLLITCVNLAGLLLARGAAREREMAVRAALGASRARIVRQLLVENLLLGVVGGALGIVLAVWGLDLLNHAVSDDVPYWMHFTLDGPVLGFALAVSVLCSLGFGLVPAAQLSRSALNDSLKEGGRSGSAARAKTMRLLVGGQLALALVLLSGAGLLVKSFLRLQAVKPGFEADGVLTFTVALPPAAYPNDATQIAANNRLVERLQTLPGVESAALISNLPLGGSNWGRGFGLAGRPAPEPGNTPIALNRVVSADYFRTMRIPLKLGRTFSTHDTASSARVAIVDESFARKYFPNENPIGQRLHYGRAADAEHPWMEIVGVVGDVHHYNLQNTVTRPGLYVPATQNKTEYGTFFAVRAIGVEGTMPAGRVAALAAGVRHAVAEVDRNLAIDDVQAMTGRVSSAIWRDRLVGGIFGGFAVLALLLSALGVYGVTSFATNQRTREIGVRMALGAQASDVLQLVLGGGARLAAISLAIGLLLALGLTQLIAAQLYEVDPRDPTILAGVSLLLAAVTCLACLLPARRATKVDPAIALRAE